MGDKKSNEIDPYDLDPDVAVLRRRANVSAIPTKQSAFTGKNPQLQPDAEYDYNSDPDIAILTNRVAKNPEEQQSGFLPSWLRSGVETAMGVASGIATPIAGGVYGIAKSIPEAIRTGQAPQPIAQRYAEQFIKERPGFTVTDPQAQQNLEALQQAFEASKLPPVMPEGLAMKTERRLAGAAGDVARQQLQAQFGNRQVVPKVSVQPAMQSGGAAAAVPENVLRGNIDAVLANVPEESGLHAHISAQPPQKVNIPALETRALEEKHGVNLLTSQRTGDLEGYTQAWNHRTKNGLMGDFEQQPKQLAKAFEESKRRHAPDITSEADASDLGQKEINALTQTDAKMVEGIDNAYKKFRDEYVNMRQSQGLTIDSDFPVDGNAFLQNTQTALKNELLQHDVPPSIKSILDDIKNNDGKMTYSEFINLDKRLSAKTREGTGSERAAAFLIRNQLNDIPLSPEAAALQPFYENAKGLAKQRFDIIKSNPAFRKAIGEAADLKEASSQGESLNAAKFHKQFVSEATPEAIRRLKAQIPEGDIAHQAITYGELERAKRAITNANESRIKSDQFADFIRNNKSVLREALPPEAMQDLMEIGLLNSKIGKPEAGAFNYSNSWTSMMGDLAKQGLLGLGEAKLAGATGGASIPAVGGMKMMFEKMNKDAFANSQRNPYGGLTKD